MTYYQEPFFLDQQFRDESYFTGFPTDDDEQNPGAVKCFDSWPTSLDTQQQQLEPALYTLRSSSIDSSYVSPYLDSLESPFTDTAGPLELHSNSSSPLEYQSYGSPDESWPTFESKISRPDPIPVSSPVLADPKPPAAKMTTPPRSRSTRSSATNPPAKKGGRPSKRRQPSSPQSDSDSALQKAKHAHSIIERRYRDNLNGKMMQLHRVLLTVETPSSTNSPSFLDEGEGKGTGTGRVRKSDIMTRAISYIQRSEVQLRWLGEEVGRLREQAATYPGVGGGERARFAGVQMQVQRQRR